MPRIMYSRALVTSSSLLYSILLVYVVLAKITLSKKERFRDCLSGDSSSLSFSVSSGCVLSDTGLSPRLWQTWMLPDLRI